MQQSSQSILIPDGSSSGSSTSGAPSLDLSVGKAILAKEVLRLRELKAHLQKQLSTPVEPDASRNEELIALQRSFEREQELREYEIQVIRAEIMSLKAQLVDDGTVAPAASDASRNQESAANGNAWATLSPGTVPHPAQKFEAHFMCRPTLASHSTFRHAVREKNCGHQAGVCQHQRGERERA